MSRAADRPRRKRGRRGVLALVLAYARFNLSAGMEYRASFLLQVFGMALNNSAFILFWAMLYGRIGASIRGYAFGDVMFVWAMVAVGYGLAAVFLGNSEQLSRTIFSGELDVYLLQPKPLLPNVLASRMMISGWGDIAFGLVLFGLTQSLLWDAILLFLAFAILVAFVFTAVRILYHSVTFFAGNAETFASMASEALNIFTLYPGSIYQGPVLWLLHSLIPAALVAYIPVELFRRFDALRFLGLVGADALVIVAALLFFRLGLRRYESGNRMGTRI